MRALLILAAAAALSAPAVAAPDTDARGEAALAKLLAGRVAGSPRTCLPPRAGDYSSRKVPGTAMIYGSGATIWVNRFASGCPQLGDFDILVTVSHQGQVCRGDFAQLVDQTSRIDHGTCVLGDFTPYTRAGSGKRR